MALYIDQDGTISLVQGDSGEIVVSGLNTDKNCEVYFAIRNKKRVPVGSELMVQSNGSDMVTFVLNPELTNLLTVPKTKEYETYYYGIKVCFENTEDTVVVANNDYGSQNRLIVYPLQVEGV